MKKSSAARLPDDERRSVLSQALRACRPAISIVGVFSLGINLLMLVVPLYMMQVYDRVIASRSVDTLIYLTVIAASALLVLGTLEALRSVIMLRVSGWLHLRLDRVLMSDTVARGVEQRGAPSIQALRDLSTFRSFLATPAMFALFDAPWMPLYLGMCFVLHVDLGLAAVIGAAILVALATWNEFATRRDLETAAQDSAAALNVADSAVRNADAIQAMGMLRNVTQKLHTLGADMIRAQTRAGTVGGIFAASTRFVRLLIQVAALGLGAWLVLRGELTPGGMIASSILMARALSPIDVAIGSWKSAASARSAFRRLRATGAGGREAEAPMPLPVPKGALSVENVTYQYPGAREPLLRSVTFALAPGEAMGLIGATASGKTTLARVLIGNLAPRLGAVRLDGADMAHWNPDDRGRHVGYLPQDVELFAGRVRDNIARLGAASAEEVVAAAQLAGVHEMILSLPQGYETEIGLGGLALSGGQRQRIGLARAVFGNPRFLVLDEPNANLDHAGEQALLTAIEQLKARGATVIVIAHRPNVLRKVDKILVLKQGMVQMFGPRDAVIAEAGLTAVPPAAEAKTVRNHV